MPFLIGSALAYFLDPVADRIERLGLSRRWATAITSVVTIIVMATLIVAVLPVFVRQMVELVTLFPEIVATLDETLTILINSIVPGLLTDGGLLDSLLASIGDYAGQFGSTLATWLYTFGLETIYVLLILVTIPISMIYMLADWDRLVNTVDRNLPRGHSQEIRRILREIDTVLSGFVRGQVTVCICQATFYSVALMAIGLYYGLVIGIFTGLVSFIPLVGLAVGGLSAIGLALFQFWSDPVWIGAVVAVIILGQVVEDYILVPRLVGDYIGIHPFLLLMGPGWIWHVVRVFRVVGRCSDNCRCGGPVSLRYQKISWKQPVQGDRRDRINPKIELVLALGSRM